MIQILDDENGEVSDIKKGRIEPDIRCVFYIYIYLPCI